MSKVTIKLVAERAGVSVATVDRVLNKRPGVRAATITRVMNTIEELRYSPSSLANDLRGDIRIAFVLPDNQNTFMKQLSDAVDELEGWAKLPNASIRRVNTKVFDAESLTRTLESLKGKVDGIAVVAIDHPSVREVMNELASSGIELLTLVSDIPSSARFAYVGQDNTAAGKTAALLMGRFLKQSTGSIGLLAGSLALSDHVDRRAGFEQVMGQEFQGFKILPVRESEDYFLNVEKLTRALIEDNPDIVGLYNVGAGNRGVVNALRESGRANDIVFIGHELTSFSRKALIRGEIDALIHQDYREEARNAALLLYTNISKIELDSRPKTVDSQIILKHNLPYI